MYDQHKTNIKFTLFNSLICGLAIPYFAFNMDVTKKMPTFKTTVMGSVVGFVALASVFSFYKQKKLEEKMDKKYTPIWLKLSKR